MRCPFCSSDCAVIKNKLAVVDGVESVRYDASRKMILVNEEDCFFLG